MFVLSVAVLYNDGINCYLRLDILRIFSPCYNLGVFGDVCSELLPFMYFRDLDRMLLLKLIRSCL